LPLVEATVFIFDLCAGLFFFVTGICFSNHHCCVAHLYRYHVHTTTFPLPTTCPYGTLKQDVFIRWFLYLQRVRIFLVPHLNVPAEQFVGRMFDGSFVFNVPFGTPGDLICISFCTKRSLYHVSTTTFPLPTTCPYGTLKQDVFILWFLYLKRVRIFLVPHVNVPAEQFVGRMFDGSFVFNVPFGTPGDLICISFCTKRSLYHVSTTTFPLPTTCPYGTLKQDESIRWFLYLKCVRMFLVPHVNVPAEHFVGRMFDGSFVFNVP
jgi:hypothetical protein